LEQPIIAPVKNKKFEHVESTLPATSFDFKYLAGLMGHPHLIRNVAFIGHLHHGKTSLVDLFIRQTHPDKKWNQLNANRYTDTRHDEQVGFFVNLLLNVHFVFIASLNSFSPLGTWSFNQMLPCLSRFT
jgi:hypothetical protein